MTNDLKLLPKDRGGASKQVHAVHVKISCICWNIKIQQEILVVYETNKGIESHVHMTYTGKLCFCSFLINLLVFCGFLWDDLSQVKC